MTRETMLIETVDLQKTYVSEQKAKGKGLGIVFADAFLRGMRDIGYKNPAWSIAEIIDNAFQAAADFVSVRFGFKPGSSGVRPDMLAICDNGNGMIPEMIGYAVRWGGTTREGDRTGFGRYGYGLPSSSISLAKRYTIYSKTKESGWHAVTVDIDELADAAGDLDKTEKLLQSQPAKLPEWLLAAEDKLNLKELRSGTAVVLEDLDRLRDTAGWKKVDSGKSKLLENLGMIYRHWIPEKKVMVDGVALEAVDPLFLMEHGRFYAETPVHAVPVEVRTFEVETPSGKKGNVSIRASFLPANFQLANPADYRPGAKNNNRFPIMRDHNGILVCREWRHIDTVTPNWTKFQNYDMNVKVEVNFDPTLDEYFGITTAKQQIVISEQMWEKLQHSGKDGGALIALVQDLRKKFMESQMELKAGSKNRETIDLPRPSVAAMEQSEKFEDRAPEPSPEQVDEAMRNLEHAADELAVASKRPRQEVVAELQERTAKHRWEIEFAAVPEGPFYRPYRLGEQKRVILNTDHPFFTKLYEPSGQEVQAALEVVLFVLAGRELDSTADASVFYKSERQKWSERLRHALDKLNADSNIVDKASAVAEAMHMAAEMESVQSS